MPGFIIKTVYLFRFVLNPEEREQTSREQSINRSKLTFFSTPHEQALSIRSYL